MRSLVGFIIISGSFLCASAAGQDLGSGNKLFGAAKRPVAPVRKTTKAAPPKKSTAAKPPKADSKRPKATAKKAAPAPSKLAKNKSTVAAKPKKKPFEPIAGKTRTPAAAEKKAVTAVKTTAAARIEPKRAEPDTFDPRRFKESRPEIRVTPEAALLFEDLIEEGNLARDARNYSTAEAAYTRAKPIKPRDPRAVYGLGNLYSDQQRWEDAETAYRTAIDIDNSSAISHIALSYVLTQPLSAESLSERYEEAEKLARRAINLAPSNPLAFDQLGVALELRGQISSETENAYRRAIALDSGFAPAYAHLARLLRRRGLENDADQAYKNAVKRADGAATKILVADVMQSEQRFAESEKLLKKALEEDARNPAGLLLLGRALIALGKFGDAERVLQKSLAVSPNAFTSNSLLGDLYARQGKLERAEHALLQAAGLVTPLERRRLSRQFEEVGDGYLKSGNRQFAERAYRQAAELDADRPALTGKLSRTRFG